MQKAVYICDNCKKIIGDIPHISLNCNIGMSGIAIPPNPKTELNYVRWHIERVPCGFMHFHISCIDKFFKKMLDKVNKKVDKTNERKK